MTLRLTSTATVFESASWAPTEETVLQLSGHATAVVPIQARAHADAPWATIETLRKNAPMARIAKLPELKLVMSRNAEGQLARVWDNM
ncbi:hypothetical protein D3C87_1857040 [compost metagenome]